MNLRIVSVAFLLTALPAHPASAFPLEPRASTGECRTAWAQSSASRSCHDAHIQGGGQCSIKVDCVRPDGKKQPNQKWVTLVDATRLVNCNGRLGIGSC